MTRAGIRAAMPMVAIALLSACSGGSARPSPPPATSPPANQLSEGLVVGATHLKLTGDLSRTVDWALESATNDPEMTSLAWGQGLDEFFIEIGPGDLVVGEHGTSPDLTVNLALGSTNDDFVDRHGECRVTFTKVEGGVAGKVRCDRLVSETGTTTVVLTGTFSAGQR
jgi:hypothetical protein